MKKYIKIIIVDKNRIICPVCGNINSLYNGFNGCLHLFKISRKNLQDIAWYKIKDKIPC